MKVKLAKSRAGHDKDQVYVIVREDREYVYLADGKYRLAEKPKRKNRKHIQVIADIPAEAEELLSKRTVYDNVEIKRALKLYQMRDGSPD